MFRISASSGFVLCVGGRSHRKLFLSEILFFCVVFRFSQVLQMLGFLTLLHLLCASVAIAIANLAFPRF